MPPIENPCAEHRTKIAELDRRLAVIETLIGETSADGIRGVLADIGEQLGTVNESLRAIQLAQAKAVGAVEGASWAGRLLWAVLGGAISAGVLKLLGS